MAIFFIRSTNFRFFITSCPAVRSINAQKRWILASIGARLERFVFQNFEHYKSKQFLKLNFVYTFFFFFTNFEETKKSY